MRMVNQNPPNAEDVDRLHVKFDRELRSFSYFNTALLIKV